MKIQVALMLLAVAAMPASAQSGPTEIQQQQACMGDAMRLCSAYIPDRAKITGCMASQHDQLSAQCRAVFDASADARAASMRKR